MANNVAKKVARTLPAIKSEIGHIPQRLKLGDFDRPIARLDILRHMTTQLVREERCEFKYNRAVELRPYIERLIQLGIHRGESDDYTREMVDWWITESSMRKKFYENICVRLRDATEYTQMIRLPKERLCTYKDKRKERWVKYELAMLELNGHPFDSIDILEENRKSALRKLIEKSIIVEE
ncbi:39S ribosomal protein L17, mitochondrial [Aphelenchoides besseyi]|nr:39S ribosomal protein L17, mitochondrial [Aphelenchoides besseyi]